MAYGGYGAHFVRVSFICLLVMAGFPGYAFAEDLTGTWQCVEYSISGRDMPEVARILRYELRADGTYIETIPPGITVKGTYGASDGIVILRPDDGRTTQGLIKAGRLIFGSEMRGARFVYERR